jgi:hypothetical protein
LRKLYALWHNIGAPTTDYETISHKGHVWTVSNFTFDDFKAYGRIHGKHPRFVAPFDATREAIKAYLKAQRLKRNAAARRERRSAVNACKVEASDLDCRSSAIITVLDTKRWQSIRDLMQALKGIAVFYQPNGRPMKDASLRRVIARELAKPVTAQMIIIGHKPAKRGDILVVRRR